MATSAVRGSVTSASTSRPPLEVPSSPTSSQRAASTSSSPSSRTPAHLRPRSSQTRYPCLRHGSSRQETLAAYSSIILARLGISGRGVVLLPAWPLRDSQGRLSQLRPGACRSQERMGRVEQAVEGFHNMYQGSFYGPMKRAALWVTSWPCLGSCGKRAFQTQGRCYGLQITLVRAVDKADIFGNSAATGLARVGFLS